MSEEAPRPTIEERLEAIERRLGRLERRAAERPATPPVVAREGEPPRGSGAAGAGAGTSGDARSTRAVGSSSPGWRVPSVSAALVLGWSGAAALVLAAGYLVRLSIVYGWLTPARQMAAAAVVAIGLVAGGLVLRLRDRDYAGLLGAAGVAVLYLTVFAAHLHHGLIGAGTAVALAVAVAALSLGLHAVHRGPLFVSLALAGSYATPLLVPGEGSLADLAVYLTIWNVVYGALSVGAGRRAIYLAAVYASLIVFDLAAADAAAAEWRVQAGFQAFQFALFGAVVAAFAVRHGPMRGRLQAALHYGALVLFYAVEYPVLSDHVPAWAPWIAVAFALALYGVWAAVGRVGAPAGGGGADAGRRRRTTSLTVVHAFGALVLFHAVWIDAVAWAWRPAAALAMAAALLALPRIAPGLRPAWKPWWTVAALLFVAGWIHMAEGWHVRGRGIALAPLLAVLWPAGVYVEYARRPTGEPAGRPARILLIGLAHLLAVVGWALLVDRWWGGPSSTVERLWLSMGWAGVGVLALVAAARRGDRLLARSSLGIFALFAGKVAFVDLDRTASLVRVGILAVLGAALYAGGWIYRRAVEPGADAPGRGDAPGREDASSREDAPTGA